MKYIILLAIVALAGACGGDCECPAGEYPFALSVVESDCPQRIDDDIARSSTLTWSAPVACGTFADGFRQGRDASLACDFVFTGEVGCGDGKPEGTIDVAWSCDDGTMCITKTVVISGPPL